MLYRIINIATHSETKELFVDYQALYGELFYYIRPLDMFFENVDKEKYPDSKDVYRFTE